MIPEEASGLMVTTDFVHISRRSMKPIISGPRSREAKAGSCMVTNQAAIPVAKKIIVASAVWRHTLRKIAGYVWR